LWGLYHGAWLVGYRYSRAIWDARPAVVRRGATFLIVLFGWVLFRAADVSMAGHLIATMFGWRGGMGMPGLATLIVAEGVLAWVCWRLPNTNQIRHVWRWPARASLALLYVVCLFLIYSGARSPFLYFQF
jgi:alginate O-acetyltransferase complex protein AlgI